MTPTGSRTGLVFAIYTIGNIVGSFFCGPFTDWWGRRWGMFIGGAIIIAGTCVQAPATSREMFMGGRFILGFGVATCATAGPSYVAEMAHPAWRGTLTGLYNTFWFVGGVSSFFFFFGCLLRNMVLVILLRICTDSGLFRSQLHGPYMELRTSTQIFHGACQFGFRLLLRGWSCVDACSVLRHRAG